MSVRVAIFALSPSGTELWGRSPQPKGVSQYHHSHLENVWNAKCNLVHFDAMWGHLFVMLIDTESMSACMIYYPNRDMTSLNFGK